MNILVKRLFAFIIDLLILGCFILILKQFTTIEKLSLKYASLFLLLFFRDFTFKGASVGKKIMRIRIYDSQWNKPSFFLILKRTCVLIYVNFDTVFQRGDIAGEGVIDAIAREYKATGTRVVENNIFKKISAEAKKLDGKWSDNMSKLYNEYIRNLYSEK